MKLSKTFSKPGKLLCGVPQGPNLRPLVFLFYINDISEAVNCELLLYADDTCLIFQHNDIEIEIQFNRNFTLICDWFLDNKTKSIIFSSKCKIKKASPLNIQYEDKKSSNIQK